MADPVAILNFFQLGLIVKLFLSVLVLFYFVFTAVIYRQITLMTQVLDSNISPFIKLIAMGQVIAVAGLFFLTILLA